MKVNNLLFESAFRFAPIGMALVSLDGKFLKVNQSLCDLLGYSDEELLSIDFQSITFESDLQRDLEFVGKMIRREIPNYRMEKRYIHKSGKTIWALLSVSMIGDGKSDDSFFISQIQDISEIKKAQEALAYNSKMIALGEMASGIAHEINNPLAIINLNARAIEEVLMEPSSGKTEIASFASKIKQTVMRINDVVVSLRKLSRNSENLRVEKVQLQNVIHDALALCFEKFKAGGVSLSTQISDISIECRSVEISQVLINLLNNAFHALQDSKVKEITVESKILKDIVKIEVSDSGPGIPENIREKIMEPFFTTKPVGVGTGLGLSISRNIIDSHHGRLYLDEKSKRTKFVIELPISGVSSKFQ